MEYGYEIKFWNRALTAEEIFNEYLISNIDGPLQFIEPEPEPEHDTEGIIFLNSSDLGDNIIIDISQPASQSQT